MTDTTQLRRWTYQFLIAIAFAIACGRIVSVQRVYEPAFHRDPVKEGDRRPVWPSARPDAMPMFGSNDRARWATIRALVHDRSYVVGKREPQTVIVTALATFNPHGPLQAAVMAQAGYDVRTDTSNPRSHTGILFKPSVKEHGWATIDRVMNPDTLEFYSSKPPLLSTLLAALYWVFFKVTGLSLIEHPNTVVRAMLILVTALPFAGYLWLLTQFAERWGKTDWGKLYIIAAGAFATMVTPFLITLNNHTFATFSVMAAWWSALCIWDHLSLASPAERAAEAFPPSPPGRGAGAFPPSPPGRGAGGEGDAPTPSLPTPLPKGEGSWQHFVSAGFFSGFAVTNEMPALAFAAAICVLVAWMSWRRTLLWFLPALLVPLIAYFATNYIAMGQVRPAQSEFGNTWYQYEGSHWNPPPEGYTKTGIDWAKLQETRATYAMHMLVGHHGLFSMTPIWLLAFAAMLAGCLRAREIWRQAVFREPGDFPWFVQPVGLALSVVVISFFIMVESRNYGGFTNGLRWLMWLTPIWLTCLMPMADRLALTAAGRVFAGALFAVSIFSASYQLWSPWRHPWIFDLMIELGWKGY